MNKIIIRNVIIEDASNIARVHASAWKAAYRGIVPDDILDSQSEEKGTPKFIESISKHIESQTNFPFLVAVLNDNVVGFAHSCHPREAPVDYDCELGAIYVDPQFHSLGVGSALVCETAIKFKAAGFGKMIIWSFTDNPWRRFYEKIGGAVLPIQSEKIIGAKSLQLVAYGWTDLASLIQSCKL